MEDESKKCAACTSNHRTCHSNGCKCDEEGFAESAGDKGAGDEVELLSNSAEQDGGSGSTEASVGKEEGSCSSPEEEGEETAEEDMDTSQILFGMCVCMCVCVCVCVYCVCILYVCGCFVSKEVAVPSQCLTHTFFIPPSP